MRVHNNVCTRDKNTSALISKQQTQTTHNGTYQNQDRCCCATDSSNWQTDNPW